MGIPRSVESFERLHRARWSIGEVLTSIGWLVSGTNGGNVIEAFGETQTEAWYTACQQAEAVGMLANRRVQL